MFDERSPIYRQIADQIRADVLNGVLEPGKQIMSTNAYAAFHRINPATAARAFQELVEEGVLYKRRGVGMFISSDARALLVDRHRERFFGEVVDPMLAEAEAIGVPLDAVVERIRAHQYSAGQQAHTGNTTLVAEQDNVPGAKNGETS